MGARKVTFISVLAAALSLASAAASLTRGPASIYTSSPSVAVVATAQSCDVLAGDLYQNCWAQLLDNTTTFSGPAVALRNLHELSSTRTLLGSMCHEMEHSIGRSAFLQLLDVSTAIRQADTKCQYGYVHGVLEAYAQSSTKAGVSASFGTACGHFDNPEDAPLLVVECTHGLGHAAAVVESQSIKNAVLLCDLLGADTKSSLYCAGGVVMEYGQSLLKRLTGVGPAASNAHGPGASVLSQSEARKPCDHIPDRYKQQCWGRISLFWGGEFKDDVDGLITRCGQEAGQWVSLCSRSAGEWVLRRGQVHPYAGEQLRNYIVSHCRTSDPRHLGSCLAGAVSGQTLTEIALGIPFDETLKLCEAVSEKQAYKECRAAERGSIMSIADKSSRVSVGIARGFSRSEMESLELPGL